LWSSVEAHAFGAEGGGHKTAILSRTIASTGLPSQRIIYIGDNLNDVRAGLENGVHFIGFSREPGRLETLSAAGAALVSADHQTTGKIVRDLVQGL
jgi:phosphoglycolate phosphatase-like HAD superfamily hydrolase